MSVRDSQRQKVYDAERGLHGGRTFASVAEMQTYVEEVLADPWVRRRWEVPRHITVLDGRGRRRGGHEIDWGRGHVIKMPTWTRYEVYLLHEIAHALDASRCKIHDDCGGAKAPHGWHFVSIMALLLERRLGKGHAMLYKAYLKKYRVKHRRPITLSPEERERRAEQMRLVRAAGAGR